MTHASTQPERHDDFHATGATHTVFNQPPQFAGVNLYASDRALREAVEREGGGWGESRLRDYGALAGGELTELGFAANRSAPELRLFDAYGRRLDAVDFHPAYHRTMSLAKAHGLHGLTWQSRESGAQVVRSALAYLHNQVESGTMCPITMTHACIPALRHEPAIAARWEPGIVADAYDPRDLPAERKRGLTVGMGMTEKQGGSDVRANTTRAYPLGAPGRGRAYELIGHKWFFSAPMSDAFLVLAYTDGGLSCFLLPRWRPDGSKNSVELQRLKDKLGDRSNASSEVELRGAYAEMVGEEGRGVRTILEMVAQTRLDCALGSAGLMRHALVHALHHTAHREAFGKRLAEQPLMQNVLADLALEQEAALVMAMRLARAFEESQHNEEAALFARIATPVTKYWVCKRTPAHVNECQECLGGIGYIEDTILPRLYRQAPLNSIWEGCGNVQCLDVLRALQRNPGSLDVFLSELRTAQGAHSALDAAIADIERRFGASEDLEASARSVVERMALALQAALLVRAGHSFMADPFCSARLAGDSGLAFGTLPHGTDVDRILERAMPTEA